MWLYWGVHFFPNYHKRTSNVTESWVHMSVVRVQAQESSSRWGRWGRDSMRAKCGKESAQMMINLLSVYRLSITYVSTINLLFINLCI